MEIFQSILKYIPGNILMHTRGAFNFACERLGTKRSFIMKKSWDLRFRKSTNPGKRTPTV